jgi:hypothetical protein
MYTYIHESYTNSYKNTYTRLVAYMGVGSRVALCHGGKLQHRIHTLQRWNVCVHRFLKLTNSLGPVGIGSQLVLKSRS